MQRARLLAVVAVLAVFGGVTLTGCRSEAGVAAYVGDTRISESRVEQLVRDAQSRADAEDGVHLSTADCRESLRQSPDPDLVCAPGRDEVVGTLVLTELGRRMVADRHLSPLVFASQDVAAAERIPRSSAYASARAEMHGYLSAVTQGLGPVEPTAAELRYAYDRLHEAKALAPEETYEVVAAALSGDEEFKGALGLSRPFADSVKRYHVVVSPRYRTIELPVTVRRGVAVVQVSLTANTDDQR